MRHALLVTLLVSGIQHSSEPISVRHMEGTAHAFLALKSLSGKILATGDLIQVSRNDHIVSRLIFHFRDGSLYNEVTEFSQHQHFHLISNHLIEKGRSFPVPVNMLVEASGQITQQATGSDGQQKTTREHLELPADVSNGLLLTVLMNIRPGIPLTEISMVAPMAKPRLIKLTIEPHGEQSFSAGGISRQATNFLIKIKLGGLSGIVAPLVGKQPADLHFWIMGGAAPAFIRSEGQFYDGGPVWCVEQVSPRLTS